MDAIRRRDDSTSWRDAVVTVVVHFKSKSFFVWLKLPVWSL